MESAKTHEELRAELIGKAAQDGDFRARLVDDPKAAIKEALRIDLPESVTVQVHEDTAVAAHLVLPPDSALSDTELEGVAAGHEKDGIYENRRTVRHSHDGGPWHGG